MVQTGTITVKIFNTFGEAEHMLRGQMLHEQMMNGQTLHGQMLHGSGSLVNSQGWFHKLEMSSTILDN